MKAFPILDYKNGQNAFIYEHKGMDLRDYFAAKALQGLLNEANNNYSDQAITELAYSLADAMMEARNV
jgi:hypothetical protein